MPILRGVPEGHFHHSVYRTRLKKLRAALDAAGVGHLLITNPVDVRYLAPFSGEASYALVGSDTFHILSDFRFQEELRSVEGLARVVIRELDMLQTLADLLSRLRVRTLSFQSEHLSVAAKAAMSKKLKGCRLNETSGLLTALRVVKDEHEVAAIKRSARIQEQSLLATLQTIRAGQAERQVAARLEFEMKLRGSDQPSFESIVAAGANSALPHARPTSAKVKKNNVLLIDWGAKAGGYCSDMTRVFALGKWPARMREVYGVVLEAHLAGIAAVAPGRHTSEVDGAARRVIERAGYGEYFGHGTGHGIGLDIHEDPRLSRGAPPKSIGKDTPGVLRPGMVVTIEPGIYLPGVGGVRIEDDILVTKRSGERLCTLPKDLAWATL